MLSLGLFQFSLRTLAPGGFDRQAGWSHAGNARFGARDAYQFIGPAEETISLPGSVVAELADGAGALDELRAMAASGDAWPLVDGTGRVHGAFVITRIKDEHEALMPDGRARRIAFSIDLLRVDADPAPAASLVARA